MSLATLSPWSRLLLQAYYYGSLPRRLRDARHAAAEQRAPIMILFYHRVADHTPNDWTLSTRRFEQHIRWLQSRFELISLHDAQARLWAGGNSRPAVCITFDDGYADNCHFALPLLVRAGIPVTYFVSSEHVLHGTPFPHDLRRGQPLAPNTVQQLRSLVDAGVHIGAHTRTHADLGRISDLGTLRDEVVGSRDALQDALQCQVPYFAFPYGLPENLNDNAFSIAHEAGLRGVCSAYGGYNFPGDDPFHLQRIHADPEMIRFKNWLTVDPRKVARVRRYRYEYARPLSAPAGSGVL